MVWESASFGALLTDTLCQCVRVLSEMTERAPDPLFVVLTRAVGLRKAIRLLLFITQWGYVQEFYRGPLKNLEEYAEWWHVNERNAYRDQKLFREAFPNDTNPNRLWEQLQAVNPQAEAITAQINRIRSLDLATPRWRRPSDVDEFAAMIATLAVTT